MVDQVPQKHLLYCFLECPRAGEEGLWCNEMEGYEGIDSLDPNARHWDPLLESTNVLVCLLAG